jgi:DNA-binding transcriptional LysR family regulator
MDRFENMETFIRVVEAGSISGAAERNQVAKSVVSRRLKELEGHLGVELFHRTTRKMNLTDTGRRFYQQVVRILEDVKEVELSTTQSHAEVQGRLKVALPLSFGLAHMGPAINDFLAIHPKVEFDLDFNDRQVDLIQEGFDLAIRIANLQDSSLMARKLAPIKVVICASPAYLEKQGTPKVPEDLYHHQCLLYSLMQDYQTWVFTDKHHQEHKIKITPHLKASVAEFMRDAALNGQGISILPSFVAYKDIECGALVTLLDEYQLRQNNAYAIYPPTRHLSQRVRAFVNFLAKRFEGTPYWDNWQCDSPDKH